MFGLALNFESTHQLENSHRFSQSGKNKKLLIGIDVWRQIAVPPIPIISRAFLHIAKRLYHL